MDKPSQFISTPVAILIGAVAISLAILMNGGIIKVGKSASTTPPTGQTAPSQPTRQAPDQPSGPVKVSIDDDPVLGDKNAKVTLIEFSDYECPFCKRHFDQVYSQLKKDYIDTGKVKLVFRDYPLSFHDPMATFEANAANCSREQGGDSTYFKFHDEIFARTKSGGNGLTKDDVYKIASDLGLNQANFKACADSDKYSDEIKKDFSDGGSAGVSGTPSFFVGKSDSSGTITGQNIVGAQPYTAFQTAIDALLK